MKLLATMLVLFAVHHLAAQQASRLPQANYAFPAGAAQGDSVQLLIGGQRLNKVQAIHVTGDGVEASFTAHYPSIRNLRREQRVALRYRIEQRRAELTGKPVPKWVNHQYAKLDEAELERAKLPANPWFDAVETLDIRDLAHLEHLLKDAARNPGSAQFSEQVAVNLKVDPYAATGERELRIATRGGLSNPLRIHISRPGAPEAFEKEPNDPYPNKLPTLPQVHWPLTINGQVLPGDVDRFYFDGKQGQALVIEVFARRLIPYLADAVPGWFQPTLTLYDPEGREVAFVDDTAGSPDPLLEYVAPADGRYAVEVRDALYRGRDDFVYRLFIGNARPPEHQQLYADAPYTGNPLQIFTDAEPNGADAPQPVLPPCIMVGAIRQPGDVDCYRFRAPAGGEVVLEVEAHCFKSPLDSVVRLLDDDGNVLAFNDDHMQKRGHLHTGPGLITRHADSYLRAALPGPGIYRAMISDACDHGGSDHQYRLRISPPRPDFEVRVTPSSVSMLNAGAPLKVYVNRQDGFDGEICLRLEDAPEGFRLSGATIPAGCDEAWITLHSEKPDAGQFQQLRIVAEATIHGRKVVKSAMPADDAMQAFLWRHLTPARELIAYRVDGRRGAPELLAEAEILTLEPGGLATVRLALPRGHYRNDLSFELMDPPPGIRVASHEYEEGTLTLSILCDEEMPEDAGNLVVGVMAARGRGGAIQAGVLPAIPYVAYAR